VTAPDGRPLLLVTVGTDHHPFDRLVRWVDTWLVAHEFPFRCLMQIGDSTRPGGTVEWHAYLEFDALQAAMQAAAVVVVCHGGPSTILGARHAGAIPIVVPRQSRLGEHVDDHQVLFTRRLAGTGSIFVAETVAELHALLNRAVAEPATFRAPFQHRGMEEAVRSFERLINDLLPSPAPRLPGKPVTESEGVVP
jgi:UDP-N-acetylglucosamine transferase subunit ALG13